MLKILIDLGFSKNICKVCNLKFWSLKLDTFCGDCSKQDYDLYLKLHKPRFIQPQDLELQYIDYLLIKVTNLIILTQLLLW